MNRTIWIDFFWRYPNNLARYVSGRLVKDGVDEGAFDELQEEFG